jgi:hypothetical protein
MKQESNNGTFIDKQPLIRHGIAVGRLISTYLIFWTTICTNTINETMPWYNGDYPPSYKNQSPELRAKAVEIANSLLEHGAPEGIAIATGLKKAREFFQNKGANKTTRNSLEQN